MEGSQINHIFSIIITFFGKYHLWVGMVYIYYIATHILCQHHLTFFFNCFVQGMGKVG